jgi:hypothetical protein
MAVYDHTDETIRQEIEHKYQDHKTIENTFSGMLYFCSEKKDCWVILNGRCRQLKPFWYGRSTPTFLQVLTEISLFRRC